MGLAGIGLGLVGVALLTGQADRIPSFYLLILPGWLAIGSSFAFVLMWANYRQKADAAPVLRIRGGVLILDHRFGRMDSLEHVVAIVERTGSVQLGRSRAKVRQLSIVVGNETGVDSTEVVVWCGLAMINRRIAAEIAAAINVRLHMIKVARRVDARELFGGDFPIMW